MLDSQLDQDLDQYDPKKLKVVFADQVDRDNASIPSGTIWYKHKIHNCYNGIIVIEISTPRIRTLLQPIIAVHTFSDFLNGLSVAKKIPNCGPCNVLVWENQKKDLYDIAGSIVVQNKKNTKRVPFLVIDLVDNPNLTEEIKETLYFLEILKRAGVN